MVLDAYNLYKNYHEIKAVLDKHQISSAKVFGYMNNDTEYLTADMGLFLTGTPADNINTHNLQISIELSEICCATIKAFNRNSLYEVLFGPRGKKVKKITDKQERLAYIEQKFKRAIDLEEVVKRGKVMGEFASIICQTIYNSRLLQIFKSKDFNEQDYQALANIYACYQQVIELNLPKMEGKIDFFKGMVHVYLHNFNEGGLCESIVDYAVNKIDRALLEKYLLVNNQQIRLPQTLLDSVKSLYAEKAVYASVKEMVLDIVDEAVRLFTKR